MKLLIINFFLFFAVNLLAIEPHIKSIYVKKADNSSYEVDCVMSFPNIPISKLHEFCWNVNNINRLISNEPVEIRYFGDNNFLSISYVYKYFFFRYYSMYNRKRADSNSTIYFEMVTNNHNIPFIPKIKKDSGEYSFSLENNIATIHYVQHVVCDREISNMYLNYVRNKIVKYFNTFAFEVNKTYNEP